MTNKQRIDELRRQMQVSLRAGRIEEYTVLLDQLTTMLHPKNSLKPDADASLIKS